MRGEHEFGVFIAYSGQGSSPHARGTQLLWVFLVTGLGIIPACAGNTP